MPENQMKQFAPLLIVGGLMASFFWFGDAQRKLPSEFNGYTPRAYRSRR